MHTSPYPPHVPPTTPETHSLSFSNLYGVEEYKQGTTKRKSDELDYAFLHSRTKRNLEEVICIDKFETNQRNSRKMEMCYLNYEVIYPSPLLSCSWRDLA